MDTPPTTQPTAAVLATVALDNISQGLAVFDAESRLVLCNAAYLKMYRLPRDIVKSGISLRELLECKVRTGTFFGDIDQTIEGIHARVASGDIVRILEEWIEGRVIAIVSTPLGDGGWVATHDDVTEFWQATHELRRTKNFLDNVINHVPAAIIVKDAMNLRFVLVNKNGEDYLGRSSEALIGHTAQEIYGPEVAKVVTDSDRTALSTKQLQTYECAPLHRPELIANDLGQEDYCQRAERRAGISAVHHRGRDRPGAHRGAIVVSGPPRRPDGPGQSHPVHAADRRSPCATQSLR